jgi:hypothetical protein
MFQASGFVGGKCLQNGSIEPRQVVVVQLQHL